MKNKIVKMLGVIFIAISMIWFLYINYDITLKNNYIKEAKECYIGQNNHDKVNKVELNPQKQNKVNPKTKVATLKNDSYNTKKKINKNSVYNEYKLNNNLIGFLQIHPLNLTFPIYNDSSRKSLRNGVGLVESTDYPKKDNGVTCVVAGHRGGANGERTFLNIDKLKNGDIVTVDIKNEELIYEVFEKIVVEDHDWSKFNREKDSSKLILMTCHPYPKNNKRLLVVCKLKNWKKYIDK